MTYQIKAGGFKTSMSVPRFTPETLRHFKPIKLSRDVLRQWQAYADRQMELRFFSVLARRILYRNRKGRSAWRRLQRLQGNTIVTTFQVDPTR